MKACACRIWHSSSPRSSMGMAFNEVTVTQGKISSLVIRMEQRYGVVNMLSNTDRFVDIA